MIKWIKIKSDCIKAIAYNSHRKVLHVEFRQGTIYSYLGIGKHRYRKLLKAESKGKYFNEAIRHAPSILPTKSLNEWRTHK